MDRISTLPSLLTVGSVPQHIRRLAVPMVIGVFAMISVNLIDTYFVGLLGTSELAAMSFTFPIIGLIINVCMGLGIGVTATVSRLTGAEKFSEAQQVSGQALILALLLASSLALLGFIFQGPIFRLMGAKPELLSYLFDYMRWWFVGLPFLVMVIIANGVLRAKGDSKTPMRVMIFAAIINAILDPLLIFGLMGLPRLELEGAAIATLIARLSTFSFTIYLLFKRDIIQVKDLMPKGLWSTAQTVGTIGVPAAMTNALTPFSAGLVTALIALHGSETVAGYGLAVRFESLFLLVPMVLGGALSPFVGQNWGARLNHRVIESLIWVRKISIYWGIAVALVLNLFVPYLAQSISDDPVVQNSLSTYLRVISVGYALQGVIYAANATFNATSRPFKATLVSTLNSLILALPFAYLGDRLYGYIGIVAGLLIARAITGLMANQWVWSVFEKNDQRIALNSIGTKSQLYQLETSLPNLALDFEKMIMRLGHLPDLYLAEGREGHLSYFLKEHEVAHLFKDGTFDICLPPQLRDAVVEANWGQHHRREHDSCWITYHLKTAEDIEYLIRLLCLAQAYVICLDEPVEKSEAKSEIGQVCEVTRTMENKAELTKITLPGGIFMSLVESVASARKSGVVPHNA